eukprot:CAMPEP_0184691864 /NCGR_PEP_ID=MMETSP0313-20130426/576_1 /TAXON_ID=2792 /ORGANISM="Porphyridium aerugineum, Strain SAG 1380-2" /LENGTH=237 /DNA_ID=CAMNT_0027149635 /DNA_START=138 /DNA_END=851 /DNA_ORIENTATION=-
MDFEAWPTLFASQQPQREEAYDIVSIIDQVFHPTHDPPGQDHDYIYHVGSWLGCESLDSLTTKLDEVIKHAPDTAPMSIFAQSQADSLSSLPWKPGAVYQTTKNYPTHQRDCSGSFPVTMDSPILKQPIDRRETSSGMHQSVEIDNMPVLPRQSSSKPSMHPNRVLSKRANRASSERNFKCAECHAMFKRRSHLKSHVDAVHLRCLRFECKYCLKVYSSNSTMRKHCRNVHNTKEYA